MSLAKIYGQKVHISLKLANSMQVGQSNPSLIKILKDSLQKKSIVKYYTCPESLTLVLASLLFLLISVCNQIRCELLSNLLDLLFFFVYVLASFSSLTGPVCIAFLICLSFQKKTFSFVVESVLFFSIHAFTNQTAGALDHTFSSLNILLIFYRKYLLGLENTFDPFQLISQWLFKENFILGCINSTKPMAQALLYSKNEKTQASKFRILLMNNWIV